MRSTTAKTMRLLSLFCGAAAIFTCDAFLSPLQSTSSSRRVAWVGISSAGELGVGNNVVLASSEVNTDTNQRSSSFNRNSRPNGNSNSFGSNTRPNSNPYSRNSNPRPSNPRPSNSNFNSRPSGGGGGGGAGVLNLAKPMKLRRIVDQTPMSEMSDEERKAMQEQQPVATAGDRNQRGGGGDRNQQQRGDRPPQQRRPQGAGGPGGDTSTAGGPAAVGGKDAFPKRNVADKKKFKKGPGEGAEDAPRRASLRVGTGKKGRAAEISQRRGSLRKRDRSAEKERRAEAAIERKTVYLPDGPLSVAELAEIIDEKPIAVIKLLMTDLGVMASMTQNLDPATCIAVAEGFGMIIGGDEVDEELLEIMNEDSALSKGIVQEDDDPLTLKSRAPVVTIMGHVDHGKTSLLDSIRNTAVTAGEFGGITQHIAAYQVEHRGNPITFIDTPGHAAFTDMRERGANITDIVILVVAADDGVKQQTADSIMCARQAGVPLVIAINKCDLETADPMKVMTELTKYEILTEDFGGDVLSSQISAKQRTNLDDLLDKIMLQAEIQDLKANPDRKAEGIVIEAKVERGLGTVATCLIKKGTLRVGDIFVAGETYGRVRALISTADGKTRLDAAGPSIPVRVVGFEGIPGAGDIIAVADDDQSARELAENRQRIAREKSSSTYQSGLMSSMQNAFSASKEHREMCVVVKADVQGSAEALTRALRELKLENEEALVTVKVLVSEAGDVTKSDIAIASVTPGTTVIAFNVAASYDAMEDARTQGIALKYYNIVYDAIESVESRMQEVLSPTPDGEYVGSAVVQEVFNIGGTGNIAGSRCADGVIKKGANVRVMRDDKILMVTKVISLRNFKSETDTIEAGNECGIGLMNFEDFEPDDVIECYVE